MCYLYKQFMIFVVFFKCINNILLVITNFNLYKLTIISFFFFARKLHPKTLIYLNFQIIYNYIYIYTLLQSGPVNIESKSKMFFFITWDFQRQSDLKPIHESKSLDEYTNYEYTLF